MNISEKILKILKNYGIKHIFLVVGGGAMFLNDAIRKSGIQYVCFHHEQAAAIAAEGYARINQELAVVCVTSGPGGLNCLTGVMGQWTDSVPVLYLSGNVRQDTMKTGTNLRQLGDQEINIVDIVKPITKYATMIKSKHYAINKINKAIKLANSERFGPVWIDLPLDVQKDLC